MSTSAITNESILEHIKSEEIEWIDCMFTDLFGTLRSITVPAQEFKNALKYGLSFDGSSIPGCTTINESDLLLWPDITTFVNTSHIFQNTARIMCDMYRSSGMPYEADPRTILKNVMEEARSLGYEFLVGPEVEFFVLHPQDNGILKPSDNKHYFQTEEYAERDAQKKLIIKALRDEGIGIEKLHHEVAPGQFEMSIHYANALDIADQLMICKHHLKYMAHQFSWLVTFMPKPIADCNGSGMHIHFSLFDTKHQNNAFYNKENSFLLSDTAFHFIAGVLHYAPDLTALLNASVNSYKRLVPGHEAPIYQCWAIKNRSAMIRIPQIDPDLTTAARAEIRSPDALCNPYLAFAGLLKAGLEGIKQKFQLPLATDVNLYHLKPDELVKKGIQTLPTSLEESVRIFEKSDFIKTLLGSGTAHEYAKIKRTEIAGYKKAITPWEIEQYL